VYWWVDVRLPGKGNSNSNGARPVHLIITMIKWIRTSKSGVESGEYPQAYSMERMSRMVSETERSTTTKSKELGTYKTVNIRQSIGTYKTVGRVGEAYKTVGRVEGVPAGVFHGEDVEDGQRDREGIQGYLAHKKPPPP